MRCDICRTRTMRSSTSLQISANIGRHWLLETLIVSPDIEATLQIYLHRVPHFRSSAQASSFRFRPWKWTQLHRNTKRDNTHTHTKKKQTLTHTHTQRSVQVNLTISGCTVSTDFSWVSRNYFAPPFSTPCRSCLCSFTFPRNWLRKRVSPGNLPPLHGIPYNPTHKCQNWISPTVRLDTQV